MTKLMFFYKAKLFKKHKLAGAEIIATKYFCKLTSHMNLKLTLHFMSNTWFTIVSLYQYFFLLLYYIILTLLQNK